MSWFFICPLSSLLLSLVNIWFLFLFFFALSHFLHPLSVNFLINCPFDSPFWFSSSRYQFLLRLPRHVSVTDQYCDIRRRRRPRPVGPQWGVNAAAAVVCLALRPPRKPPPPRVARRRAPAKAAGHDGANKVAQGGRVLHSGPPEEIVAKWRWWWR